MLWIDQRPWIAPVRGHSQQLDLAPEQQYSRNGVVLTCSCISGRLGRWEEANTSREVHTPRDREVLWQSWCLDPRLRRDNSQERRSSHSLGFRHMESKDVLWLDHVYKPDWVELQLARWGTHMTPNPIWLEDPSPCRIARQHQDSTTVQTCWKMCDNGRLNEVVDALGLLVHTGCRISASLFYTVLKGCSAQRNLALGRRVHALTVKSGYESNAFLANHILRMYASHGRLQEATDVFTKVETPDAFMWSSIISAHIALGVPKQAIQLYHYMCSSGVKPDGHVFVAALKACASASDLQSGRHVHADVLKSGLRPDVFVTSCLVDMYAKCGTLEDARRVFDSLCTRNVVTWNSMINGYVEHGLGREALALYVRMDQEGSSTLANNLTFACLLKACAIIGDVQQGKQLHEHIVERGLNADILVGNCLVDMYAKCGSLEDARRVFESWPGRDVVTWNTMMNAYTEHGLGQEALALHVRMQEEGVIVANLVTYTCLLRACATIGAIQQGKQVHLQMVKRGLKADIVVGNCLVGMYAQCGNLDDARGVFRTMPEKDVISWNVMLSAFGHTTQGHQAIHCFHEMLQSGVQPNGNTFICLLMACTHEGLVNEGKHYFESMVDDYNIVPTRQHYLCMVDLLGRSGHVDEAEKMLLSMPFDSDVVGWTSLLYACRSHGDIDRGRRCFENLVRLDPLNASGYVLMANIYADAGRWADVDGIERLRKSVGASKKPAKAGIEVNNQVHTFVVGENKVDVSCKLTSVNVRLKEDGGHLPHTQLVLKPVSEKRKEDELCGHAEKLALAYGLLNTPHGTSLLVTKNLRMCSDCHSATQIMSRIEKREIVVRDAHRVHRFVAGTCSCGDRP